jgi:hypothetical protein
MLFFPAKTTKGMTDDDQTDDGEIFSDSDDDDDGENDRLTITLFGNANFGTSDEDDDE